MSQQFRILIVEDVATDAEFMLRELKRADIHCDAHRVESAVDYLRELNDFHPHVILSDYTMPRFDGLEALRIASQSYPHIPFIFVSGTLGEDHAVRALKNGATDYVLKTNLIRLPAAVERATQEAKVHQANRALERQVRESEKRYRELFQGNPHPMWVYDIETLRFLAVNDTAVVRYGFSREEFMAMTIRDIRPEKDLQRFLDHMAKPLPVVNEPQSWQHRKKSGELIDIEIASHDLVLEGKPARIVVAYDITERRRAEQELRESEAKYRQLIEQAADGIFISDAEGIFLIVNARGCELLGYTQSELVGMNGKMTYLEGEKEIHSRRMEAVVAGEVLRFERMIKRKDGSTFPAEVSLKMLDNGTAQVIFHDITGRRNQEQKIARLSRIQQVLSGINSAIVRIRDRQELFNEACRIAVEHGGLRMAWIGLVDKAVRRIEPKAFAGNEDGFLRIAARLSLDETSFEGQGRAALAVRTMLPIVSNDLAGDPQIVFKKETLERGYRAGAVLPLLVGGEAIGVFSLYASETGFFDDQEMKMLTELAGDISFGLEYIAKGERVDYLAYYDPLTGLPNRTLFSERLGQQLHTRADSPELVAVALIDVERLRLVNDTLGRRAGDELLRLIARRLESNAETTRFSNPAHMLGDSFAVTIRGARDANELAQLIKEGMKGCFGPPFLVDGKELRIDARAGVSAYPTDGSTAESLLQNAEAALRNAKRTTERFVFYASEMTARVAEILALETKLRKALELEQFVLHYQPKFDVVTHKITGVEALIRWNDPATGMVPPLHFIHILEETGMIFDVGRWALRQALADQQRWQIKGLPVPRVAVNVSAQQLRDPHFVRDVQLALASQEGLNPALELEITESLLMEDIERNIERLKTLRDLGVTIAIDDFGTGYSSLNYLARLPMDTLKIDRSFVVGMAQSPESETIVSTIISLAHALGLKVVAEGVETQEQLNFLRSRRCDEMQGFLLSRPVASEEIASFLTPVKTVNHRRD